MELERLAIESDVRKMPAYSRISNQKLVPNLQNISNALSNLQDDDKAIYIGGEEQVSFNIEFHIVPEDIEKILTRLTLTNIQEMILKVKIPDYLGDSQWELRHETRIIRAKILDTDWLNDFQARKEDVRPGDSLHAKVRITVNYGYDSEVVSQKYEIMEAIDKIEADESQMELITDNDEEN
ncbi:MAG: hypothetical protein IH964_09245 [Candidatus Dadabacteria bacterium]|nr:hypothetical protein [Candidatus Dadabacteria bacterium]